MATSVPPSPIVFYDIAMRHPIEQNCCSPNPWKARYVLNFKGLPYSTRWVALPDIARVRKSLHVPPTRKFADGTDYYTLPMLEDPATGSLVGDSFDIAVYLQKTYPDAGGDLFPPQTLDYELHQDLPIPLSERREEHPEYAKFNEMVDTAFSVHVQLGVQNLPFEPATAEASRAEFVRRAGVSSWEEFALVGEAREKVKASFRDTLGGLSKLFLRDTSGPFLLGTKVSYGDLIVGAWLQMMRVTLPESRRCQLLKSSAASSSRIISFSVPNGKLEAERSKSGSTRTITRLTPSIRQTPASVRVLLLGNLE